MSVTFMQGIFGYSHLLVQSTCTDINSQKHSQVPFIKSGCFSGFHTFLHLMLPSTVGIVGVQIHATHGAPTTPPGRRVISMFDVFYLIGYRHICHQCQKTFMNYDPNTIAKMPLWVQLCFPADLMHRSGMDIQTQKLVTALVNNCVPVAKVHAILKELQTSTHSELEASYYDRLCAIKKTSLAMVEGDNFEPPVFSSFGDKDNYSGAVMSCEFMLRLVLQMNSSRFFFFLCAFGQLDLFPNHISVALQAEGLYWRLF